MKLINKRTHKTLSENIYLANSFIDATFGLIFKTDLDLHFKTRFGIHTLFMKKPIDLLITNREYKIVKIKENLKPWRFYIWNLKYNNVYELKQGQIEKTQTKIGDSLSFR